MTARKPKIRALTDSASNEDDKKLLKAKDYSKFIAIGNRFLREGLRVDAPTKPMTLDMVFDVRDYCDEKTGLEISAVAIEYLVTEGVLMRSMVDEDRWCWMHRHDERYGFNRTTVNYGLPRGNKVSDLHTGTEIKARFSDHPDLVTCIVVERDTTTGVKKGGDLTARVLARIGKHEWVKLTITFSQIMFIGNPISYRF